MPLVEGKIRFLALTGGTVATGIKVKATVNHIVAGEAGAGEGFTMPLWGWIVIGIAALVMVVFTVRRYTGGGVA